MTDNPTFVQALADATQRPVEISPVREATGLGAALLAGHRGRPSRVGRRARHHVETARRRSSRRACSTAIAGATRSNGRAAGSPSSRESTSSYRLARRTVATSTRPSVLARRGSLVGERAGGLHAEHRRGRADQRGRPAARGTPGLNAITRPSTASATAHALTHSASCVRSFTDVTVPTPSTTSRARTCAPSPARSTSTSVARRTSRAA